MLSKFQCRSALIASCVLFLTVGCNQNEVAKTERQQETIKQALGDSTESTAGPSYYGTLEPFASEAIYFLMTDRFVDGDPSNNYPEQGGDYPTFELPLVAEDGRRAYVGYMGGDFKGIVDNAGYIADLGFTAIWLSPIIDNPDQQFAGGEPITFGGAFKDGGKTGYHGYWGNNFFVEDEHWVSEGLAFKELTQHLKEQGIKTVLDVVMNHGSPSFDMPFDQPKFGELYDRAENLVADHQNLHPTKLDHDNPLHRFFHKETDILQLSNLNENNTEVIDYFVEANLYWIEQGVDALRIDTIKHMPHHAWKLFADGIRKRHPGLYMFAESFSYDANFIAQHTLPKNGSMNVLDFPGREAMKKVFESKSSSYKDLQAYLHLTHGPYANPYDLTTFYDNHDMSRLNADSNGFINANNWLFTTRGIPVLYYGSEIGFMAGTKEHEGNRNYFGQENIDKAAGSKIYQALKRVANLRKSFIALQRGLQLNIEFSQDTASFYRVYQDQSQTETVLVLLNKSDSEQKITVDSWLNVGTWQNVVNNETLVIDGSQVASLSATVAPNSLSLWVNRDRINNEHLHQQLTELMAHK